jgi:hypothetical protein
MEVFVSCASQGAVARLRSDIERARNGVWIDRELEGGERWWDQILEHIRSCGLFVLPVERGLGALASLSQGSPARKRCTDPRFRYSSAT